MNVLVRESVVIWRGFCEGDCSCGDSCEGDCSCGDFCEGDRPCGDFCEGDRSCGGTGDDTQGTDEVFKLLGKDQKI